VSLISIKHFCFGLYSYCVLVSVQVSIDNNAKYVPWVTAPMIHKRYYWDNRCLEHLGGKCLPVGKQLQQHVWLPVHKECRTLLDIPVILIHRDPLTCQSNPPVP